MLAHRAGTAQVPLIIDSTEVTGDAKRASARLEARDKQSAPSPADGAASEDLPTAVAGLRTGDQVRHDSYGVGTVVGLEGKGRSLTARVEFVIDGAPTTKRLILRYAPVAKI